MTKTKKKKSKKEKTKPEYMSVSEAARIYAVAPSTVSLWFDQAAADGIETLKFTKAKLVNIKAFRAWIKQNKDVSVSNV